MARRHTVSVSPPPQGGEGLLGLPAIQANGIVIFAHGSGSSRFSPRNAMVAESLQQAGLATLLFDLLTDAEAAQRRNVFDIALLADRLNGWLFVPPGAASRLAFLVPAPAQRQHS